MSLIIKKGRVVDPAQKLNEETDLLIDGGKVVKIGKNLSVPGAETVDAKGLLVFPGLIDMHVHLREPGFEYKETIASGGRAAAGDTPRGGGRGTGRSFLRSDSGRVRRAAHFA